MKYKFVDLIPTNLDKDTLYISIEYDIAKHLCPCGCRSIVVTSLAPSRWRLAYDGETVSLSPSIGNWNFDCKSHYFITRNEVIWAKPINQNQIEKILKKDKKDLKQHVNKKKSFFDLFRNF